jgi:hypothetical protein
MEAAGIEAAQDFNRIQKQERESTVACASILSVEPQSGVIAIL